MPKQKKILLPVVFMVLVTMVFTFGLAFINEVTKDTIAEQEALNIYKSILYVFDIDHQDKSDEQVKDLFDTYITITEEKDTTYYTYIKDQETIGYAVLISGKGLWGTITGHIAFSPDHSQVLGVNFIAHSETPGLGGRIDEDNYKDDFRGIEINLSDDIFVNNKATGGNVDAISGATLTSKAVIDIYNTHLPTILEQAKKEGYYEAD